MSHFLPRLNDLCHIGYAVRDMDRALRLWVEQGADIIIPPTPDPIQKVLCALLHLAGAVPVELVSPLPGSKEHPLQARLKRGGGLDHVCVFTDHLEQDLGKYERSGAIRLTGPDYACVFDRHIAFLHFRTGLVLELMDRQSAGRLPRDPLGPNSPKPVVE